MTNAQLRIYTIAPGHIREFLRAWTEGVVPLRRQFGFSIAAWTVVGEETFVWILTYHGEGSIEDADRRYYASPERKRLQPDPAVWVTKRDERWLSALPLEP